MSLFTSTLNNEQYCNWQREWFLVSVRPKPYAMCMSNGHLSQIENRLVQTKCFIECVLCFYEL